MRPVRGTQDLLPEMCQSFRLIDHKAFQTAQLYGYEELQTPIFEYSSVFHRTLGESSDMVSKETYTFLDRGNESITLRPEGTAGIARAFISNGLAQNLPLKLYYFGPMFRYERPQKGRYRQFHQFGVENLGAEHPWADVECLALATQTLLSLGLDGKFHLEINSLGDAESRTKHRNLLVEYLKDFEKELSADSQVRLQKNPLRILDSKDEKDQALIAKAPLLKDCLNEASKNFFGQVLEGLSTLKIKYQLNDRLVRGIDYYTHTVFEFVTPLLGAQSAILSGGRYDGLIQQMGGPATPGVGWASGVERLALLLDEAQKPKPLPLIAVLSADEKSEDFCLHLSIDLRKKNHRSEFLYAGNMGKKMKRAAKLGAKYAVIIGESELQAHTATVKNMETGEQKTISQIELATVQFN